METQEQDRKDIPKVDNSEVEEVDFFKSSFVRISALALLLMGSTFLFNLHVLNTEKNVSLETSGVNTVETRPFDTLLLEANAVYVYDVTTGEVLFSKNPYAQLPLASLTKVMTALVASEQITEDATITITPEAIKVNGDHGLKEGERWRFKDLLDYTLVVSSNDGAHAIAGVAGSLNALDGSHYENFNHAMNSAAQKIGLTQTYFLNESGLDTSSSVSGGYGSAQDVARLLSFVITERPHLLEATTYDTLEFTSEDQFIYNATNTNSVIGAIPGLIASKTGFTDLAGGNLAIAFNVGLGRPVVAVVLGSTYDGRFQDMQQIVAATLTTVTQR